MGKLSDILEGHRASNGERGTAGTPPPRTPPADEAVGRAGRAQWHLAARIVLSLALLGLGLYVLSNYLRALVWAVVLAIALWPLFQRTAAGRSKRMREEVLPLLFATVVLLVFVVPFALLGVEAVREAHTVLDYGQQVEHNGIPVPEAVSRLPEKAAKPVTDWWNANLAHSGSAKEYAQKIDTASNRELGTNVGRDAVHRIVLFGFALMALYFAFREGEALTTQCLHVSDRLFGERGERIGRQIVASIHGTVNGLVLVGLGEGVALGIVYFFAGVPHAILFGAFTAVASMIPFAGTIAFLLAALVLLAAGKVVPAVIIAVAGFVISFLADHFVRPSLIGGSTRLPFIWVLLGILGGVETFGLLGLFLGPAIMATLILLWRELASVDEEAAAKTG